MQNHVKHFFDFQLLSFSTVSRLITILSYTLISALSKLR